MDARALCLSAHIFTHTHQTLRNWKSILNGILVVRKNQAKLWTPAVSEVLLAPQLRHERDLLVRHNTKGWVNEGVLKQKGWGPAWWPNGSSSYLEHTEIPYGCQF